MSSNFRDFTIESVGGKIQNVSSLCSFIKSTLIEEDDIPYLETLRNKLANDDNYNNSYTNEYPIVEVLNEELLKYYIKHDNCDMDYILEILEVYNKSFIYLDKIKYDGLVYLIYDQEDDIDVISVDNEKKFIDLVLTNTNTFVSKSLKEVFNLMKSSLYKIDFKETTDDIVQEYVDKFNIEYPMYSGKDQKNNKLYKVKNGLFVRHKEELTTLITPTLVEKDKHEELRVIKKNKKYASFDLNEFIDLRDRVLDSEVTDESELEKFYFQVRYLINTMSRRQDGEDIEYTDALDVYMNRLLQIYKNNPSLLSKENIINVETYLVNRDKISSKVKHI